MAQVNLEPIASEYSEEQKQVSHYGTNTNFNGRQVQKKASNPYEVSRVEQTMGNQSVASLS